MSETLTAAQYAHNIGLARGKELGRNEAYRKAAERIRETRFVFAPDETASKPNLWQQQGVMKLTDLNEYIEDIAKAIEAEITK